MLEEIWRVIVQLHFQYTEQFVAALLPMTITVLLHSQGMRLAVLYLRRTSRHATASGRRSVGNVALVVAVAIMLLAHFLEVMAWAIFYFLAGMLPDFRNAVYLSINGYTTLGASNLSLPGRWHGLDGFEAMTAMLMFGWSTAVLAVAIQKLHGLND
jgi:hypothetical protein